MNKRRRAYKRYDWRKHCMQLLSKQFNDVISKQVGKALDIMLLYGEDALEWKNSQTVLKAGLWKITVPMQTPYRNK